MTRFRLALFAILLIAGAATAPARAGMVVTCFNRMDCQDQRVPEHVPLKGTIAEFLDPADTGVGKSVAFLVFQEVLSAISDQAGAGVIIATAPEGERVVDLLEADYHRAAEELARFQDASIALWGAVTPEGLDGEILIETYLTRLPRPDDNPAELALYSAFGGFTGVRAAIARTRFNFAPVSVRLDDLIRRPAITRARVALLEEPVATAGIAARVPPGTLLQVRAMRDNWLRVEAEDGARGWVALTHRLPITLPPRTVEAARRQVNLRSGPGTDHDIVATRDLKGSFRVLDQRYRRGHGTWYRIAVERGTDAWIAGFLVRPRWSLPAVHFMAGIYRFQASRYKDATREFQQFANFPAVAISNVNAAAAFQFAGISAINGQTGTLQKRDLRDFDRAIAETPFDPTAYNLRAVARIAVPEMALGAADDLDASFKLDPGRDDTTQIIGTLAAGFREESAFKMEQSGEVMKMLKQGTRDATAMPSLHMTLTTFVTEREASRFLDQIDPLLERAQAYAQE